jgi:hypothetical protein
MESNNEGEEYVTSRPQYYDLIAKTNIPYNFNI